MSWEGEARPLLGALSGATCAPAPSRRPRRSGSVSRARSPSPPPPGCDFFLSSPPGANESAQLDPPVAAGGERESTEGWEEGLLARGGAERAATGTARSRTLGREEVPRRAVPPPRPPPTALSLVGAPATSCDAERPRFDTLPTSLTELGNEEAWGKTMRHLRLHFARPLVVWGPTGCGKSCGMACLLRHCRIHAAVLDGTDADSSRELYEWIARTLRSATNACGQPTVVVLDDFEGFPDDLRERIGRLAASHTKGAGLLISVTQFRDAQYCRSLASLSNVRLFSPREHTLRAWFQARHVWRRPRADAEGGLRLERCVGFPDAVVERQREVLRSGDIRRAAIALEWDVSVSRADAERRLSRPAGLPSREAGEEEDEEGLPCRQRPANGFDATRRLLRGDATWQWWSWHAEERDVDLLREHAVRYAGSVCDAERMLVAMSCADASRVRSYENSFAHGRYVTAAASAGVRISVSARDVGALVPPAPIASIADQRTRRMRSSPSDVRLCEELDVPRALTGEAPRFDLASRKRSRGRLGPTG